MKSRRWCVAWLALSAAPSKAASGWYQACYQRYCGLDPLSAPLAALDAVLEPFATDLAGLHRDDRLDLIRTHLIEPQLASGQMLFIYDFPANQAALARIQRH